MNPRYPIYIPSKGRHDISLTAKRLQLMGVPHRIVVEDIEYDDYARELGSARLLVLPFSNLGQGSIPARNWIWEHSLSEGHRRHWILDDNISAFARYNYNRRIPCTSGGIFRAAEDFTDRFDNVAFSGFGNRGFIEERAIHPPFVLNTRIYSMTLIKGDLPYRWRGRYNEDTDICLRALKDGWCTIQFKIFLGSKALTMTMKGGNTDTVYAGGDHRRAFAESLVEQHPDVAEVVWKFDRWHHQVDYSRFKNNKLKLRAGVTPIARDNEYGMELRRVRPQQEPAAPPEPVAFVEPVPVLAPVVRKDISKAEQLDMFA